MFFFLWVKMCPVGDNRDSGPLNCPIKLVLADKGSLCRWLGDLQQGMDENRSL
jgi:hypothetical protein